MLFLMERDLWKMGSVSGDVRLAFGRVGEGPEPVLALHGITAQHRAFNTAARHLRHGDGIAALDLRGRGDSEKPPSGSYGPDEHARDVIRTLDYLGIERGVLVGHSMGAFVALHAALSYPERVRALVLLDGGWPRTEEPEGRRSGAVEEGLGRPSGASTWSLRPRKITWTSGSPARTSRSKTYRRTSPTTTSTTLRRWRAALAPKPLVRRPRRMRLLSPPRARPQWS